MNRRAVQAPFRTAPPTLLLSFLLGALGCTEPAPPATPDEVTLGTTTPSSEPPPVEPVSTTTTAPPAAEPVTTTAPVEPPAPVVSTAPPVAPTATVAPAQPSTTTGTATLDGNTIVTTTAITYATGRPSLQSASGDALSEVKRLLEQKTAISLVRIEVHTDSMGADQANQALSEKRALEVARGLVQIGVPCKRLLPVGFGETKPIASNNTAEDRAKNRRTTFVVAALLGKPIGGMPVAGGGVIAGDPCS